MIIFKCSPGRLGPDPPEREHAERERHARGHRHDEAGGRRARPALPQQVQHEVVGQPVQQARPGRLGLHLALESEEGGRDDSKSQDILNHST